MYYSYFFSWLYVFLVPFGCHVVTINGTMMPSLCVLHMAHLMPWEVAPGKTAGKGGAGTAPPDASHTNAHLFPFYVFKHVSAPWIKGCQGMTCWQLVSKNFCVAAGPLISWYVLWETWELFFTKPLTDIVSGLCTSDMLWWAYLYSFVS